ncbi:unnamed protein product [Clonostachys rosea]|uniref:Heterokaryon incompatibility domain-containing protein n=1 Tax=Bionectria ochroleuca TaxID=29856 RepID=A0ABY6U3I8_BIOOC|nr:unnamed protein product [Clonostachys rosea]
MFTYDPIEEKNREIRLVRLDSSTFAVDIPDDAAEPETVSLEMRHVSMNDEVEYAALSYTWGDPQDTEQITVHGTPFPVTRNLLAALKQFHQQKLQSWLWIDAICIDMSNALERHQQVSSMRAIYSQASVVHIWLGPGCRESDLAMDMVSRLGPAALACDVASLGRNGKIPPNVKSYIKKRVDSQDLEGGIEDKSGPALGMFLYDLLSEKELYGCTPLQSGIKDILTRDYWHRIWAFQELVLSRKAFVHVGTRTLSLDMFDAIFAALWSSWIYDLSRLHPKWEHFRAPLPETLYHIKGLEIRRWIKIHSGTPKLGTILWERVVATSRPFYSATDPRDILYGLLGIIPTEQAQKVRVDYQKPVAEVFAEITRALFDEHSSDHGPKPGEFGLDYCLPGEVDGSLPTWVPDWREIGVYGVRTWQINHYRNFNAAGNILQPATPSSNGEGLGMLRKAGCRVDVITEVMEPPELIGMSRYTACPIRDADAWVQQIAGFAKLGPESGPGEDYIWRTAKISSGPHLYKVDEATYGLFRKIMRLEHIDAGSLTEEELKLIRDGSRNPIIDWDPTSPSDGQVQLIATNMRRLMSFCGRNRTFFKTAKGMLGLGHVVVEVGDIVTLIWGVYSPIILRQRADGGFYFRGDAYLDGIMQGEFIATCPAHEEFSIH